MLYPGVNHAPATDQLQGVQVSLDALVRLNFRIRDVGFLPQQPVHSILNGRYASRLRGRGLNFEELRGYLPGDDPRTIDWKVTARTRKPYVRVYSEERDRPLILLIDQRSSMFFGSRLNMKSVTAAEAAAIAAWRSLSMGDRVGAVVFNDGELHTFKPLRSRQQVTRVLASVVDMNRALVQNLHPESEPRQLNEALERALKMAGHDALVCVISDGLGADARSRSLVTRINAHNDAIICFVYDPLEAELPESVDMHFSDGQVQLGVSQHDQRTRKAFRQQFAERHQAMQNLSSSQSIPFMPLSSARPGADQVRELLGRRARTR